ncbi:MAG: ABC transporter substrate-binding protein [Hydrogenophilales bacterium 28-61-11]|nr:MAG: ABC transporter substrate-binding protein [Hydrogenophilales bacterium 28-61-11]OYZ58410.1 MAG: ABC transporter substrate-binding protein [Hydrogenophilales bacterium 16-61-112]OZA44009.1 MAG: ABC transporter substrate-binding protein [Hydrogenophilales bacterium 17-61-76]
MRPGFLSALWLLFSLFAMHPTWGIDTPPLVLGIFPNTTAKQIIETYRPLANALEKTLRRRVEIYSAPNFKSFVARTRQGKYDLLLTAPHFAWLARQDVGYQPLLKYTEPVRGLLVVKSSSSYRDVNALRGRTIAIADPLAVIVLALQAELAEDGLKHNVDYRTINAGTHINAMLQALNGRADAAMVGQSPYILSPPELRKQLHILLETPPLSSLTYLTHPRLSEAEALTIRETLLRFAATPEGQAFLKKGGFGGFSPLNSNELNAFRPYAFQTQKMLQDLQ